MNTLLLPTFQDVVSASERIRGHAIRTPVMTSRTVNKEFDAEVFFKCENFQRSGAFKFRGAFNALSKLDEHQIVAEPTGCLGFAAAREMKAHLQGKRIGVLVSGGNIDVERYCSLLNA
jgi:threonine dehydratase